MMLASTQGYMSLGLSTVKYYNNIVTEYKECADVCIPHNSMYSVVKVAVYAGTRGESPYSKQ